MQKITRPGSGRPTAAPLRLNRMRLILLVFTGILAAAPAPAQQAQPSSKPDPASSSSNEVSEQQPARQETHLPVSLDKIREALQQSPVQSLRGLNEVPTFKVEIHERPKISLEDLIKSLDFKSGPVPAGGLYGFEQQRQMWNATDHPLQQPYAAFSQPELVTILVENLMGKYLAGKAMSALTTAERGHAEAAAREEVQRAIAEYCAAQPNAGGIRICRSSPEIR
jgi:hypothetical protein